VALTPHGVIVSATFIGAINIFKDELQNAFVWKHSEASKGNISITDLCHKECA
jgi:hypothetical protein